jgi:predicted O-methyltransferase YrrM
MQDDSIVPASAQDLMAEVVSIVPASIRDLMTEVELAVPEGGAWCSVEKASALVAIVLALRPKIVVELGIWTGGSAIPMAIALRHLGAGQLIAVDAWSAADSIQGQGEVDSKWWGETVGPDGHERAYQTFLGRLEKHRITAERCAVVRRRTDEAVVLSSIDVLHHDANHGPQAMCDIARWAPAVRVGGMLIIDDIDWVGDHVRRARAHAIELGFRELYTHHQDDPQYRPYCVLQRVRL